MANSHYVRLVFLFIFFVWSIALSASLTLSSSKPARDQSVRNHSNATFLFLSRLSRISLLTLETQLNAQDDESIFQFYFCKILSLSLPLSAFFVLSPSRCRFVLFSIIVFAFRHENVLNNKMSNANALNRTEPSNNNWKHVFKYRLLSFFVHSIFLPFSLCTESVVYYNDERLMLNR